MSSEPYTIQPASADSDVWWVTRGKDIAAVALSEDQARRLCERFNKQARHHRENAER